MKLVCKPLLEGIMAYWEPIYDAAAYYVTLYINEMAISKKIIAREELYCSFKGLASIDGQTSSTIRSAAAANQHIVGAGYSIPAHSGMDYYVQVQAENRKGEIISESEKVKCKIKEF